MQQSHSLPTHPRFKDLSGLRFSKLLVVEYVGKTKNGKPLFRCRCDCGNENFVTIGAGLLCGDTISCRCIWKGENIDGKRFGRWTVVRLDHRNAHGDGYFKCVCDCGNIGVIHRTTLIDGTSQSCGCLKRDYTASVTVDEVGRMFGRLTVLSRAGTDADEKATWHCMCVCGNEIVTSGHHLRGGNTRSCGCLRNDIASDNWLIHGMPTRLTHGDTAGGNQTAEHRSWAAMIQRCTNPNVERYPCYGGRGITVCDHWRFSYSNFLADMGRKPTIKHSLDRINVNGNYEKLNCRWATIIEQANNKQRPKLTEVEKHIHDLARRAVRYAVASGRMNRAATFICVSCGNQAREWHHYLGYHRDHWLDVIPLCVPCHRACKN
jgi:hypothetical protein